MAEPGGARKGTPIGTTIALIFLCAEACSGFAVGLLRAWLLLLLHGCFGRLVCERRIMTSSVL